MAGHVTSLLDATPSNDAGGASNELLPIRWTTCHIEIDDPTVRATLKAAFQDKNREDVTTIDSGDESTIVVCRLDGKPLTQAQCDVADTILNELIEIGRILNLRFDEPNLREESWNTCLITVDKEKGSEEVDQVLKTIGFKICEAAEGILGVAPDPTFYKSIDGLTVTKISQEAKINEDKYKKIIIDACAEFGRLIKLEFTKKIALATTSFLILN